MISNRCKYVATDGIRRRYRISMDDARFAYPRKSLGHRVEWYLDGSEAVERPTIGLYSMGRFAEYILYLTKHGKKGQARSFREACEFYAATRREMQNVLSTYPINKRIDEVGLEKLRGKVRALVEMGAKVYNGIRIRKEGVKCPACRDRKLVEKDARLLEEILYEQSLVGRIPATSELFRETPLTPPTVM